MKSPTPFPYKILGLKYATYQGRFLEQTRFPVRRAWFATREIKVADESAALERIRADEFQRFDEIVIEDPTGSHRDSPVYDPRAGSIAAQVTDSTPETLRIDLDPHPDGYLVLSEIYYPGWQASMDGEDIPVIRCNSILRCLRLAESSVPQRIEMHFRPGSLLIGLIPGGLALLLVLTVLAAGFNQRRGKIRE